MVERLQNLFLCLSRKMLIQRINCPVTSSMGRLFDAVSSLLGMCHVSDYEAEAAIALESLTGENEISDYYNFKIDFFDAMHVVDWHPIIDGIMTDLWGNLYLEIIASKFHNTLAEIIVVMAEKIGIRQVALTGGCFQNKYLAEKTISRLREEEFDPHWHHIIPANDGGISAGQIAAASAIIKE